MTARLEVHGVGALAGLGWAVAAGGTAVADEQSAAFAIPDACRSTTGAAWRGFSVRALLRSALAGGAQRSSASPASPAGGGLRHWQQAGVWTRLLVSLAAWSWSEPAPWMRRRLLGRLLDRPGEKGGAQTGPSPVDRGRTACKRHLIVDGQGLPLAVAADGGQHQRLRPAGAAAGRWPGGGAAWRG